MRQSKMSDKVRGQQESKSNDCAIHCVNNIVLACLRTHLLQVESFQNPLTRKTMSAQWKPELQITGPVAPASAVRKIPMPAAVKAPKKNIAIDLESSSDSSEGSEGSEGADNDEGEDSDE